MSDMTLMAMYIRDLEARLSRLERQDKVTPAAPGGGAEASFSDAEGDPAPVGTTADGISTYAARRDHVHALSASDALAKLITVDGAASGLDADLLDGQHGSYYLPASTYAAADVLTKIKTVDGSGSGLDADTLDGQHASDILASIGAPVVKTWQQTMTWAAGGPYGSKMICPPGYTDVQLPLINAGENTFYFYKVTATIAWYGAGYASTMADNAFSFFVRGTGTLYEFNKTILSVGDNTQIELGADIYPSIKPTTAWAGGLGGSYSLNVNLLIEQYAYPYNGVYAERNFLANPLPLPNFTDIDGVPKYGGTEIALLPTSGGDADTLGGYAATEFTSRRAADEVSYAMTGTGWKRVARFGGGATGRGEMTLLVAVTGADASTAMRIHAAHGIAWGTSGITIDSPLRGSRITQARITQDGTYAWLEIYFASIASGVSITFRMLRDDAWSGAGNVLITSEASGGDTAECYAYVQDTGFSTSGSIHAFGALETIGAATFGSTVDATGVVTAPAISGVSVTIADNATATNPHGLTAAAALLAVYLGTDGDVALVAVRGGTTMTVTIIAAVRSGNFSTTKDTAGKLNMYYDDASTFVIQNKRGASRTVRVLRLGN